VFVVCGESLMDVFAAEATLRGTTLDARVGGSPFNVAIGLARLARPVAFLSSISRDFLGERLLQALVDEGVDTSTVRRVDAATTLGLVGLDAHGVPSYTFYGERTADRQLEVDAIAHLPPAMRAIHLGSYATVVEPVASTLRALVERERHRTLIAYDPNIRLNVEPDIGHWQSVLQWMLPRCHLLKVSEEDLQHLLPGITPEAFAADALERGVAMVVVTRGSTGTVGMTRTGRVSVAPAVVAVVDTVGAGDTFQAALLTWLAEHDAIDPARLRGLNADELKAALTFAARAAAITCSRRGADMPRRDELPRR